MKQSHLFSKTQKNAPKDEVAKNAELLIRAGYITKEIAGVYNYLPLGLRVIRKISDIIRREMNALGASELELSVLQDKKVWDISGRWDDAVIDVWFKTKLKNDTELGLSPTNEEPLTNLMKSYIRSWRDLPVYAYQIQKKFRNETRAKSGIMRGREFLMKDLYSFSRSADEHAAFYERVKVAYANIFKAVGLGDTTYLTFASGGSFSKYSHEFQTLSDNGEDTIHICDKCHVAINDEIKSEVVGCPVCSNINLRTAKAVEVGNIFNLGTKYSEAFELYYVDEKSEKQPVIMGSYGIGPTRLMGTIVELLSDEKGIVWPNTIAPYQIHLVALLDKEGTVKQYTDELYTHLLDKGVEVLYDERDARPGEKFADADLIGIPTRAVVSEKTMQEGMIEMYDRKTGITRKITEQEFLN